MIERSLRLDYLKIILSLLVITVHIQPLFEDDSLLGWLISNGIARIAVPCFFIISGYFIHTKIESTKALKKYISHLLVIYIVWSIIYLPTYYSTIEPRSLITFAFLGYYHLWFLPALIIGILILTIMKRYNIKYIHLFACSIILFFIGYMMETFEFPYRSFCNGLFFGFPLITLGYLLHEKDVTSKIKKPVLYVVLTIGFLALLLESFIAYKEDVYQNLFLSYYLVSPALVLLGLGGTKKSNTDEYFGKLAAGIYYIHIFVLILIIPLSETFNINNFPFVAIVSILLSIFIISVNKRIKIFL